MINRRYAETAAIAGTIAAIATAFLLYKSGIFWQGSVSQLHSACSTAGIFTYIAGANAVRVCNDAGTAYSVLFPVMIISVAAAVGGLVLTRVYEVAAIREARKTPRDDDTPPTGSDLASSLVRGRVVVMATDDECGFHIVQARDPETGVVTAYTLCARAPGHGPPHRDAEQQQRRRDKAQARYDKMTEAERTEENRKKNARRSDRRKL